MRAEENGCVCASKIPLVCAICDMLKREYILPRVITTKTQWREAYWALLENIPDTQPFDAALAEVCYSLEEPPLHLAEEDVNDRLKE